MSRQPPAEVRVIGSQPVTGLAATATLLLRRYDAAVTAAQPLAAAA
ncbi:hypothetical protein [Streptomyces sp. NPDC002588]